MKIDLTKIDTGRFKVSHQNDDTVLINPSRELWDWRESELHMRSLLCDSDGNVISAGFPKFFNLEEKPSNKTDIAKALKAGTVRVFDKMDGSLVIATKIGDSINLRTRGRNNLPEEMEEEIYGVISSKYPDVLNPYKYQDGVSYLMEYTSPNNRIVVGYDKPELTFIASVDFSGDRLLVKKSPCQFGFMKCVAEKDASLTLLGCEGRPLVKSEKMAEGIVAYIEDGDTFKLVKVKTDWYIRLHGMVSRVTERYVKEFCFIHRVKTLDEFKDALAVEGMDWEVFSFSEEYFRNCIEDRRQKLKEIRDLLNMLDSNKVYDKPTRKEKALAVKGVCKNYPDKRLFAFAMNKVVGDEIKAQSAVGAYLLDCTVNAFEKFVEKNDLA